jgi:hypothetical protein
LIAAAWAAVEAVMAEQEHTALVMSLLDGVQPHGAGQFRMRVLRAVLVEVTRHVDHARRLEL